MNDRVGAREGTGDLLETSADVREPRVVVGARGTELPRAARPVHVVVDGVLGERHRRDLGLALRKRLELAGPAGSGQQRARGVRGFVGSYRSAEVLDEQPVVAGAGFGVFAVEPGR